MRADRSIPGSLIGLGQRLIAQLKTSHARRVGTLVASARISHTGEVINLSGRKDAVRIGKHSVVSGELFVFAHGGRIEIGEWVFVGPGTHIWSSADLRIGNRVLISHGVEIHDTESHPLDPAERFEQTKQILTAGHPRDIDHIRSAPIRIGDDVWIGFGATIKKGVTIGDRTIIGARAIVDTDIPEDSIVKPPSSTRC